MVLLLISVTVSVLFLLGPKFCGARVFRSPLR